MRKILRSGIFHTLALIITALYVVPLASIFLVALAPADRELQFGIPDEFAWSNFAEAMRAENFPLFFANSLVVSLASTVLQVLLCAMAGYALAKMPIPGKKTIMLVLIALIIVPPEVMMVPLFVIVTHVPFAGGNDLSGKRRLRITGYLRGLGCSARNFRTVYFLDAPVLLGSSR